MYRYRILTSLETSPEISIITTEALRAASRELGIAPPKLFLIEHEQLLGTIEYHSRIVGLAEPGSIFVLADQPINGIVSTVFHETWHAVDDVQDGDRELRADAFVGRCWGSHAAKTRFVEIMEALAEIGNRGAPKATLPNGGTSNQVRLGPTLIEHERKKLVAEIRANYYKFARAQAATWTKPIFSIP